MNFLSNIKWAFILTAILGVHFSLSAQPLIKATVSIDKDAAPLMYSPMIFGQFIEHFHRQVYGGIFEPGSKLSDKQGFRTDVIQALKELKVPVVRWPGGCFVSSYHWLDAVGSKRVAFYDKAWHVEDPSTFGTDEYIEWCRKIGAEPYICTNAGTGTPEEMSDWVEYCNQTVGKYARMRIANGHSKPYGVKFWSIGNENYGSWEMGAKTVDEWGYFVRESAKLMFAADYSVKLFAAALPDDKWTVPLLQRAGQHLNYVSIHGYYDGLAQNNKPSDYLTCMMRTNRPEEQIQHTIEILKKTGYDHKIKIAFDEWNLRGWHHPGQGDRIKGQDIQARDKNDINSTYTMADAVFSACFLNSCMRNSEYVSMACMAPVVNTRGPLFVHKQGIVKRTTYHVMKLYANELLPEVIASSVKSDMLTNGKDAVQALDAIVTTNTAKTKYALVLVNKHNGQDAECEIGIKEVLPEAVAITLTGDSPDAFNDIAHPDRVSPQQKRIILKNGVVVVPAHSIMILKLTTRK